MRNSIEILDTYTAPGILCFCNALIYKDFLGKNTNSFNEMKVAAVIIIMNVKNCFEVRISLSPLCTLLSVFSVHTQCVQHIHIVFKR